MAVESKSIPSELGVRASAVDPRGFAPTSAHRQYFLWMQIIFGFLFLEFALWEPDVVTRYRWAGVATLTIGALALIDRPALRRLGLGLPTSLGAALTLGISVAAALVMIFAVRWAGGEIPANPTWPNLHLAWQYLIWAMMQEFMLQSFFFTRFEELYGSAPAVWMAATLFAAAHLPSPVLTTFTLIGALFFCEMFRRYRSIYPIGVVHALLGLTISLTMPDQLIHHMRVGVGYLQYSR